MAVVTVMSTTPVDVAVGEMTVIEVPLALTVKLVVGKEPN